MTKVQSSQGHTHKNKDLDGYMLARLFDKIIEDTTYGLLTKIVPGMTFSSLKQASNPISKHLFTSVVPSLLHKWAHLL